MLKTNFINYIFLISLVIAIFSSNIVYGNKINTLNPPIKISKKLFFYDEEGEKHSFEEYENQLILVVFWAKWSVFCSRYLLSLNELQDDFKKLPFKVVAISEDPQGIEVVRKFYVEQKIENLKIFYDYKNNLMKALNISTIPSAFLIDQHNNMVLSLVGVINWYDEDIRRFLLSYLDNNNKIAE